jgi:hypothetical protein
MRKTTLQWLCPAASRANAETITGEVRRAATRRMRSCVRAPLPRPLTIVQPVQGRDPELETAGIWQMSDNKAAEEPRTVTNFRNFDLNLLLVLDGVLREGTLSNAEGLERESADD